ncbi:hypothetical protein GMW39_00715 [Pectobacterium parmentieri]|uniref:HNH endonuclease n=1 Tax=Pectobacterium parmentieri TaxID=1905730 RepID=UPI00137460F7|nr:HNH endonuclease [Pectobacterium parmentieri]QHQ14530.1 hypothetical protein GMW39_00715 [Pectobacterium parmentieri]QQA77022.1 HNH endonuclease [Pectobacterium parmentieri]
MKKFPFKKLPDLSVLRQLLNYDPDSGVFTWKERPAYFRAYKTWNKKYSGTVAGKTNRDGYIQISIRNVSYRAHRLAWLFVNNEDPGELIIDHINGVRNDNRINNLRKTTYSGNAHNKGCQKNNTSSGIKGVHWNKRDRRFNASIHINKKHHYLGSFKTAEEAAMAVNAGFIKYEPQIYGLQPVEGE